MVTGGSKTLRIGVLVFSHNIFIFFFKNPENSEKDDFERKKKAGNTGWDISTTGDNCDRNSNGACWDKETSPATIYRDILALTGGTDGNRDFTVSCRFGLTNEKWNYIKDIPIVIEKGEEIGICRNGNYSPDLYDCAGEETCGGRTAYGLSAWVLNKTNRRGPQS